MIHTKVSEADIEEARRRSSEMGILAASRQKGAGNVAGFLGEACVLRECGGTLVDNFNFDVTIGDLKIDVKTKSCSSTPRGCYNCSVMSYQLRNECDGYIFTRVNLSSNDVWILGYIAKARLIEEGIRFAKGDTDDGFTVKEDCVSIQIFELDELPTQRIEF